jgi:hypothetical protein
LPHGRKHLRWLDRLCAAVEDICAGSAVLAPRPQTSALARPMIVIVSANLVRTENVSR